MKTIEHLRRLADDRCKAVGIHGEEIAKQALEARGYIVQQIPEGAGPGDLRVIVPESGETLLVEVKTSRRGAQGWQWTLFKRGSQNHRRSDIVLLLAITKVGPPIYFVIPTEFVRDLNSIKMVSHPLAYIGKYDRFRQIARTLTLETAS